MPAPRRVSLQDVSCFFAHQFQESEPISEALQGGSSVGFRTCGWVDTGPHFGCSRYCTTCSKAPGLLFKRPTFPRFGAWDGESVCGHGVLPPAASKAPRLALSHSVKDLRMISVLSVVLGPSECLWAWGPGLDLAACFDDDQKKARGFPYPAQRLSGMI
jgi:hypothetical protein